MKKIALFSYMKNEGLTYLNHLKTLLHLLKSTNKYCVNYTVDIFQPEGNFVGLSIEETENYFNHKVIPLKINDGNADFSPMFDYDVVFSNNGYTFIFPENVFAVEISHAISVMPIVVDEKYAFSNISSYSDAVLIFGKTYEKVRINGISKIRKDNINNNLHFDSRSIFRNTYLCGIQPFKVNNFFKENNYKEVNKNKLVIGILNASPSIVGIASLYNSINLLVNEISRNFPNSQIIWKPFKSDFDFPGIDLETCFTQLETNIKNFKVERNLLSSTDFYNLCDIVISDGSSGAVSFLLSKAMPPIYYIPRKVTNSNVAVKNFVDMQTNKVLFANSIKELIKQINFCINLTKEQRINYFDNYCKKDLFLHVDNQQVLQNIINKNFDNFPYVDAQGNIIFPRDFPKIF